MRVELPQKGQRAPKLLQKRILMRDISPPTSILPKKAFFSGKSTAGKFSDKAFLLGMLGLLGTFLGARPMIYTQVSEGRHSAVMLPVKTVETIHLPERKTETTASQPRNQKGALQPGHHGPLKGTDEDINRLKKRLLGALGELYRPIAQIFTPNQSNPNQFNMEQALSQLPAPERQEVEKSLTELHTMLQVESFDLTQRLAHLPEKDRVATHKTIEQMRHALHHHQWPIVIKHYETWLETTMAPYFSSQETQALKTQGRTYLMTLSSQEQRIEMVHGLMYVVSGMALGMGLLLKLIPETSKSDPSKD